MCRSAPTTSSARSAFLRQADGGDGREARHGLRDVRRLEGQGDGKPGFALARALQASIRDGRRMASMVAFQVEQAGRCGRALQSRRSRSADGRRPARAIAATATTAPTAATSTATSSTSTAGHDRKGVRDLDVRRLGGHGRECPHGERAPTSASAWTARMSFFKQHGFPVSEFAKRRSARSCGGTNSSTTARSALLEPITVTLEIAGMAPDGSRFRLRERDPDGETASARRGSRARADGSTSRSAS